ncbi:MAG: efflux RND transporter periplasmic adaptor subunit [Proteobacteria bacterium]|nr:efflux RND transporter periplasmic adaptor subunit [Burkholderiales bacterium]
MRPDRWKTARVALRECAYSCVRPGLAAAALLFVLAASGCGRGDDAKGAPGAKDAKGGPPPAMPVTVAQALERSINEWDEFVGRVEAIEQVELRPRVSGYLQRVAFDQGSDVAQGTAMFLIDPEPLQVEVKRAEAELARVRTRFDLARNERARTDKLVESGAVSRQESDERVSSEKDSEAAVRSAEASLATARLNLGYTRVVAPISGRTGRAEVTAGNFVTAGQTVLTTIVKLNPIYVTFEADEQVYLKYVDLARRGERKSSRTTRNNPVYVGLANEEGFPVKGSVEFVDNRVNPQTGTIFARALVDNRDGRFTPGLFARVKLVGSGTYTTTLIDDRAIGTDQNKRFVMVVGPDGQALYREAKLGPMVDGLRVIREGLKPGETIIVDGLQRVRPGMTVKPTLVPMDPKERPQPPAKGAPPGAAPEKAEAKGEMKPAADAKK